MAAGQTGLQQLQTFMAAFDAYVKQNSADMANLTTAINNAIALLGSSEDPQVQAAVADLNTGLAALGANETALEGLTTSLSGAENPPQQQAAKQ